MKGVLTMMVSVVVVELGATFSMKERIKYSEKIL